MSPSAPHPRPTLRRERFWVVSGPVPFRAEPVGAADRPRMRRGLDDPTSVIALPFPPESAASGRGDQLDRGTLWYQVEIPQVALESREETDSLLLHLDAVFGETTVWFDGHRVGSASRGYSRQTYDLGDLHAGSHCTSVVIEVEVDHRDLARSRGKQDWRQEPHAIWYGRSSGIWRDVWFEVAPRHRIEELVPVTDIDQARVTIDIGLATTAPPGARVEIDLVAEGRRLGSAVAEANGRSVAVPVSLSALENEHERSRYLWSPTNPFLVDIEVRLVVDGRTVDNVQSYAGLRTVGVLGDRLMLNGRPFRFNAVLEQHYWPESHFTAPSEEKRRAEVELIKALGFNGVRIHQLSPDPRLLYWCDRLGVAVWGELPSPYVFPAQTIPQLIDEWSGIVRQSRPHSCVIAWVPFNESWGVPSLETDPAHRSLVAGVAELTRAIDPTRPVISNDGWEHVDSDLLGIHQYFQSGPELAAFMAQRSWLSPEAARPAIAGRRATVSQRQRLDVPLLLTEFGGVTYNVGDEADAWGYGMVEDAESFAVRVAELVETSRSNRDWSGWCYTQLTDTLQEANGLLDARRRPKIAIERLRAIFELSE